MNRLSDIRGVRDKARIGVEADAWVYVTIAVPTDNWRNEPTSLTRHVKAIVPFTLDS